MDVVLHPHIIDGVNITLQTFSQTNMRKSLGKSLQGNGLAHLNVPPIHDHSLRAVQAFCEANTPACCQTRLFPRVQRNELLTHAE